MNTPHSSSSDSNDGSDLEITQLTQSVLGVVPSSLSAGVRTFLEKVLHLNDGSAMEAATWLNSPIVALGGAIPAEEIRKGNTPALQDFWNELERRHGY